MQIVKGLDFNITPEVYLQIIGCMNASQNLEFMLLPFTKETVSNNCIEFTIDECVLPYQERDSTEVEVHEDELIRVAEMNPERPMIGWIHSHHNMLEHGPSKADEEMHKKFLIVNSNRAFTMILYNDHSAYLKIKVDKFEFELKCKLEDMILADYNNKYSAEIKEKCSKTKCISKTLFNRADYISSNECAFCGTDSHVSYDRLMRVYICDQCLKEFNGVD